jgi:DNA-binding transcriptional MocR family regulator
MVTARTQEKNLKQILDKIARLKGLADRPGTPEEAAAALAAIQRLMLKHNLDQQQVDLADRNDERGFEKEPFDLGAAMNWRRTLLQAIAKYTFCDVVFNHSGRGAHIIGERHNIEIVKGMYDYLVGEVMRLADVGWNDLSATEQSFSKIRRWKNAFRIGAGATLRQRLQEQFDAQKQAEGEEAVNALVVVKDAALAQAVKDFFPKTRLSSTRSSLSDLHGYEAGQLAGLGINLASQIDSGA